MKTLNLNEDPRPLADPKARVSDVVMQVRETDRSVVLGRGVAVALSVEAFEDLQSQVRHSALQAAVDAGERDYAQGKWVDQEEVEKELLEWERAGLSP